MCTVHYSDTSEKNAAEPELLHIKKRLEQQRAPRCGKPVDHIAVNTVSVLLLDGQTSISIYFFFFKFNNRRVSEKRNHNNVIDIVMLMFFIVIIWLMVRDVQSGHQSVG